VSKKRCEWVSDENGPWSTGCNNAFEFTVGGPNENSFKFCPYCGRAISVRFVVDGDDDECLQT